MIVPVQTLLRGQQHPRGLASTKQQKMKEVINMSNNSEKALKMHEEWNGKLETTAKAHVDTREDLAIAYTPGVAEPCKVIAEDPEAAYKYTIKANTVAVVSDGSAVLGLGNIGALAAMPVMEGKAVLFKEFGGVNAVPICLDTQDTEEIIRTVVNIAPAFGGINLEDISAPRCFEIETRLKELLNIPRDAVIAEIVVHSFYHGIHLGEEPFVHYGKLIVLQCIFCRVELVDIRIEDEERIGVPQGSHELSLSLCHSLAMETVRQPGRAVDIEVPADRVRAVFLQRVERIDGISLGLAHLLAVLILHMSQDDDILVRRLIEDQRGDRQQGVEPSSCLVHRLGDKVRRGIP